MNPYLSVFKRFVPEQSVAYCAKLYEHFGFEFQIKKARKTKLGDYRFDRASGKHVITINNDLNEFAFLITYLHEVAHLVTYQKHGRKAVPHGDEWKAAFHKVAQPVLNDLVFPPPILLSLSRYLDNPKASSCSDPILFQILKTYDENKGLVLLKTLRQGDHFVFNENQFRYINKRRTRIHCENLTTKRQYLISQLAEVKKLESE